MFGRGSQLLYSRLCVRASCTLGEGLVCLCRARARAFVPSAHGLQGNHYEPASHFALARCTRAAATIVVVCRCCWYCFVRLRLRLTASHFSFTLVWRGRVRAPNIFAGRRRHRRRRCCVFSHIIYRALMCDCCVYVKRIWLTARRLPQLSHDIHKCRMSCNLQCALILS